MSVVLLLAIIGGGCKTAKAVVTHHAAVAYAPVAAHHAAYPATAVFLYGVGDTERIDRLEKIIEQQSGISRQLAEIQAASQWKVVASHDKGPTTEVQRKAGEILTKRCISCHAGPAAKGGLDLSILGGVSVADKLRVEAALAIESMPPDNPLDATEYQAVREWVYEDKAAVKAQLKRAAAAPQKKGEK